MLLEQLLASLRSGETAEVLGESEKYFAVAGRPPVEALQVAAVACRAAAARKEWGQVLRWAEQGLSQKAREAESTGRIYLALAVAQMYLGNAYRAQAVMDQFDRLARRTPALKELLPYNQFNRAILFRMQHNHAEEVRALQAAKAGFAGLGLSRQPLQCQLEIAWAHLLHGETELAKPELDAATRHLSNYGDRELLVDSWLVLGLYHRLAGNLDRAELLCRQVLEEESPPCRQEADALWILGCIAQARGNLELARQLGEQAYQSALKDYWVPQAKRIEALRCSALAN